MGHQLSSESRDRSLSSDRYHQSSPVSLGHRIPVEILTSNAVGDEKTSASELDDKRKRLLRRIKPRKEIDKPHFAPDDVKLRTRLEMPHVKRINSNALVRESKRCEPNFVELQAKSLCLDSLSSMMQVPTRKSFFSGMITVDSSDPICVWEEGVVRRKPDGKFYLVFSIPRRRLIVEVGPAALVGGNELTLIKLKKLDQSVVAQNQVSLRIHEVFDVCLVECLRCGLQFQIDENIIVVNDLEIEGSLSWRHASRAAFCPDSWDPWIGW